MANLFLNNPIRLDSPMATSFKSQILATNGTSQESLSPSEDLAINDVDMHRHVSQVMENRPALEDNIILFLFGIHIRSRNTVRVS